MQSSRALRALPVVVAVAAASLPAQPRFRVTADGEWFHQGAGEVRLARLARGTLVREAGPAQGEWAYVRIEGWIIARSVGPAARPGYDLGVSAVPEENLRSAPNGARVAVLLRGVQLNRAGEQEGWMQVWRDGWVRRAGLEPLDSAAREPSPGDTTPSADSAAAVEPRAPRPAGPTVLYRVPGGEEAGRVGAATALRVLSRGDTWSRVQFEGWVRTEDLREGPPGVLIGVTAAELRAEPQRYEGQVLRWTLQFIAADTADELRPDMPSGATYLLAKGPLPERAFVYVVVPDSLRGAAARLAPLTMIDVTARVRRGRSRHLGHPVVDLLALEARR